MPPPDVTNDAISPHRPRQHDDSGAFVKRGKLSKTHFPSHTHKYTRRYLPIQKVGNFPPSPHEHTPRLRSKYPFGKHCCGFPLKRNSRRKPNLTIVCWSGHRLSFTTIATPSSHYRFWFWAFGLTRFLWFLWAG